METPNQRMARLPEILGEDIKSMAQKLGMTYQGLWRIMNDKYKNKDPNAGYFKRYIELLRHHYWINPDWILHGKEPVRLKKKVYTDDQIEALEKENRQLKEDVEMYKAILKKQLNQTSSPD